MPNADTSTHVDLKLVISQHQLYNLHHPGFHAGRKRVQQACGLVFKLCWNLLSMKVVNAGHRYYAHVWSWLGLYWQSLPHLARFFVTPHIPATCSRQLEASQRFSAGFSKAVTFVRLHTLCILCSWMTHVKNCASQAWPFGPKCLRNSGCRLILSCLGVVPNFTQLVAFSVSHGKTACGCLLYCDIWKEWCDQFQNLRLNFWCLGSSSSWRPLWCTK